MKYGAFLGATSFLFYISLSSSFLFLKSILIFLSTFGYAALFNVVFIFTPTPIRATVCGFSYLTSRLGAMLVSPMTEAFGPSLANFIFIIFGYGVVACCFYLEETLGQPIKDEIPEASVGTSFVVSSHSLCSDVKFDVVSELGVGRNLSSSKYFNK